MNSDCLLKRCCLRERCEFTLQALSTWCRQIIRRSRLTPHGDSFTHRIYDRNNIIYYYFCYCFPQNELIIVTCICLRVVFCSTCVQTSSANNNNKKYFCNWTLNSVFSGSTNVIRYALSVRRNGCAASTYSRSTFENQFSVDSKVLAQTSFR